MRINPVIRAGNEKGSTAVFNEKARLWRVHTERAIDVITEKPGRREKSAIRELETVRINFARRWTHVRAAL